MPQLMRVERHDFGPRLWIFGRRVHECHAGVALVVAGLVGVAAARALPDGIVGAVVAVGAWMVVKDWRDFFPSSRDTAAWSAGVHRRPAPLRGRGRLDILPPLAGAAAATAGLLNVVSALTPDFSDRAHFLLRVFPHDVPDVAHQLVLPAGVALLVLAAYLARRRRRAWTCAVSLLLVLGVLNLLKGLDYEEALVSWAAVGLLVAGREAFYVRHDERGARATLTKVAVVACAAFGVALAVMALAAPWASPQVTLSRAIAEAAGSLLLLPGPLHFREPLDWIPVRLGWLGVASLLAIAYVSFRPLALPRRFPQTAARRLAQSLVAQHGADTLSFFKLRSDKHYLFSDDKRAFVGYQVHGRVLVVSGDPVGPPDAVPPLFRDVFAFADQRGLKVAVLGASEQLIELGAQGGLRSFYIGDEAVVETECFSLEGRFIRKVRQSTNRLETAGYTTETRPYRDLPERAVAELEEVSARWLDGSPERGFSMALDTLRGEHLKDTLVTVARDARGHARGFLHFVPSYGRQTVSLSFMRREPATPNGLTEFMIAQAIHALRERGIAEISLNFAVFARLMHDPQSPVQRLLGRLARVASTHFQLESLYRFNAKFRPRWQPRYLLYEGALGLPRAGLAALRAEGQLPDPLRRR